MYRKADANAIRRLTAQAAKRVHNRAMNTDKPTASPTPDECVAATRRWLENAVIGLNLCPFAKSVYIKDQVRFVVSAAESAESLLADLADELVQLRRSDPTRIDTTLLIHPHVLHDFLDFNDFLDIADAALGELGLAGEIQIASFHPQYQFADTDPDDIGNFTNRAPYPTLHLLREASIDRAVNAYPDAAEIFERNIKTMERLGHDGWKTLLEAEATLKPEEN
jgi:uncharacterized protein